MSAVIYEAQAAALRGITSTEKVVALILAARMNSKIPGWGGRPVTFPELTELAEDAEVDKRTVSRAIAALKERGIIQIIRFRKDDGKLSRNYYVWTAEQSDAYKPDWMTSRDSESQKPEERMTAEQQAAAAAAQVHPVTWAKQHAAEIPTPEQEVATADGDQLPIETEDPTPTPTPTSKANKKPAEKPADGFDDWWKQYPKKVKKLDAEKAYRAALKRGVTPKELLDGLQRQKAAWKAKGTEPQYIPYPATWLRAGSWEDELDTPAPSTDSPAPAINPNTGKPVTRDDFGYACIAAGIDPNLYINYWKPYMGLPTDPAWPEWAAKIDRFCGRA